MHDDPTLPLSADQPDPADLALVPDGGEPTSHWGPFKLLARVGSGGFGEVYRAWDPSLEREVALKLLIPHPTGAPQTDTEYTAMLREARTLAAIQHPNIVHVYGIDRHDDRVGFWTDFVKGRTLSSLIATQGSLGYREAALIALDITRALSAVHRAHILHRDIKPGNVMREEGGRILLMDFGLSTISHRDDRMQASVAAGTPDYMAPELWRGQPASVQTDIYAVGVLLFYLVTGETPVRLSGLFADKALAAIARSTPLMDLRSDLPESFLRTVSTALDPDPDRRFSSAGQLAAALSECLGTPGIIEHAPPESTPSDRTASDVAAATAARNRRSDIISWVVIAGLILTGIVSDSTSLRHLFHLDQLQTDQNTEQVSDSPAATSTAAGQAKVPADVSDELLEAQALLQHSYKDANLAAAVTGFQSVLARDPANALAHAGLGSAFFAQYRNTSDPRLHDQAKAALDKALGLDSNLASACATLARMDAMAGHTDLALQQAQKAIRLEPRNPEARAALAEVYSAQGKQSDAVVAIQKAIDLDPENSMWLVRLGSLLLDRGDSKSAAAAWQKAIDLDPQNVSALFDLGVVEMRSDQFEQARSNFEKVLKIQPDADSYKSLATISLLRGNYSEAIGLDKKALELDPRQHQSWGNLAGAYAWSGDHAAARATYKQAIDLAQAESTRAPGDASLSADLANYYASIGDAAHSVPLIRKSLALSPEDPNISYIDGEAYELLGKRAEAIPLIARSIASGRQPTLFQRSPEMASLRADPAFQTALAKAKSAAAVDTAHRFY